MTIPYRGQTGRSTYFITACAFEKRSLFQTNRMAKLLTEVFYHYRQQQKYLLQEFVIMPDHFHLIITPTGDTTLEKAMQLIKGGFSFRAKKELSFAGEIWQTSFEDRRIRDESEYIATRLYIHQNPIKRGLTQTAEAFPWSSASRRFELDDVPQRLKPDWNEADMQG